MPAEPSLWREVPTLSDGALTLLPLFPEDGEAILAASRDGEMWKLFFTAAPGPDTIDAWMERAASEQRGGRSLPLKVVVDGVVVGSTRFMRLNPAHRRLEIGTTFYAASRQRTGVNTRVKRLMLAHAFDTMGCLAVQFRTDWFNRPSRTAIERLGAKMDGVLRNHTIMADGRVRDTVCYSVLANEWAGVRQNLDFLARD